MKDDINYLNNIINEYEDLVKKLGKSQTLSIQDTNISRINFFTKIISFKKENDELLLSYNNKLLELFRLVEEKDKVINDLYSGRNK